MQHYCGWQPSADVIDALKAEGAWNNDWDASLELLRRHGAELPDRAALIDVFSGFYFGGDPDGDPSQWTGFIGDEPLLVDASFFTTLSKRKLRWGFVSGAELLSAKFVLEEKLIMNLRISRNIPVSIFDYEKLNPVVFHLEENKLIKTKDNEIVIRKRGKKMLDYISRCLVDCY